LFAGKLSSQRLVAAAGSFGFRDVPDWEPRVMAAKIKRRSDASPVRGEHEYGDVKFADPTNKKYPIDSPEHVRAAWSYINHADNAAKYEKTEVATIKRRIRAAAKKHGVEIASAKKSSPKSK
jgi:hypothetical protein